MNHAPQMQVFALRTIATAIQTAGSDPQRVLARVGLQVSDLDDVDRRVPKKTAIELMQAAAEETGDPHFALHWGAAEEPATLGAVGYVMLHSPSVGASLFGLCRYLHLVYGEVDIRVHTSPPRAAVRYRPAHQTSADLRHDNEYSVAFVVRLMRLVIDEDWAPREVWFRHPEPADTRAYSEWLDVPVRFEADYNAVEFDYDLLDRENPAADPTLLPILERHIAELNESSPARDDVLGLVRGRILHTLPSGDASVQAVASQMEMSVRTLQRRLGEAGVSFRDLVEEARRELATRYLEGSDASLTEIAFMAGYSEVSSFTRAFRRWTGTTPLEFRKRAAQGAGERTEPDAP